MFLFTTVWPAGVGHPYPNQQKFYHNIHRERETIAKYSGNKTYFVDMNILSTNCSNILKIETFKNQNQNKDMDCIYYLLPVLSQVLSGKLHLTHLYYHK